jgi:hypothetical protein
MSFDDFLAQHTTSILPREKDSLLSSFWKQSLRRGIPLIDTNKRDVAFLYRGRADSAKLYGCSHFWFFWPASA